MFHDLNSFFGISEVTTHLILKPHILPEPKHVQCRKNVRGNGIGGLNPSLCLVIICIFEIINRIKF